MTRVAIAILTGCFCLFSAESASAKPPPGWIVGIINPNLPHDPDSHSDLAFEGVGAPSASYIAYLEFDNDSDGNVDAIHEQDPGTTSATGEFSGEFKLSDKGWNNWQANKDYYVEVFDGGVSKAITGVFQFQ